MSLEHLPRVQLIREALACGDVGFAAQVAFNLEHALVYGLHSDDSAIEAVEPASAAEEAATGVQTSLKALGEAVRDPRYDELVDEMEGPPEFSLVISGSLEGTTFATFAHGGGRLMRRRLLDWLGRSVEAGDVLDRLLERFPVRGV